MSAQVKPRHWLIRGKWVTAARRETQKQTKIPRWGTEVARGAGVFEKCGASFAWLCLKFCCSKCCCQCCESQESGRGDDVPETVWHVGQQLPHFWPVPHFCASLWRRCHLSRNLSDSWEWNEVRNQSHILFRNVSVVPICRLRSPTGSLSPSSSSPCLCFSSHPLSAFFPAVPLTNQSPCHSSVQKNQCSTQIFTEIHF